MTLAEEYAQRHSINVPFVKHVDTGCIFFKTEGQNSYEWNILTIAYARDSNHPGSYSIRKTRPRRNGFDAGNLFENAQNDRVEWDQYEDHLLTAIDLLRVKKSRAILEQNEIILVGWEMFVYICDSVLGKYANQANFFKSLDPGLSLHERYAAYQLVSKQLGEEGIPCFGVWTKDMMELVRRYAHWLARLADTRGR